MSILPQPALFSWQEVEAAGEISRLTRLLDILPDGYGFLRNPDYNYPKFIPEELRNLIKSMQDFQKAAKEVPPMEINCPPKKIELKKPEDTV